VTKSGVTAYHCHEPTTTGITMASSSPVPLGAIHKYDSPLARFLAILGIKREGN